MTTDTKEQNLEDYRRHLNRLIETYTETYRLPKLTGAEKQISWAADIRIRFIDKIDRHKTTISAPELDAVARYLREKNDSRYWIDNKEMTWQEHLIHAKRMAGIVSSAEEPRQTTNLITIDTRTADITVSIPDSAELAGLLGRNGFARTGDAWTKPVPKTDTGRAAFIESLSLALLSSGHAMRIVAEKPEEPRHEGRLGVENGRLCLETSVQHIWKAASAIGTRKIWMDTADSAAVHRLLTTYDIICTNDAKTLLEQP